MNWRLIESALVRVAKANDYHIEQDSNGDSIASMNDCETCEINLTELAKDLATDLAPTRVK